MDSESLKLIRKVWRHSGVQGNVWVPHIVKIGQPDQKFREGAVLDARNPNLPELRDSVDWYWTPAVSSSDSRKAKQYPAQRALWVDCDEGYDDKLLQALKPSYMWETSPGHKQAIWLMREPVDRKEFHRDGLMGMLTQALGGDKSGVDVGQLLRVPGTVHHKGQPHRGTLLRTPGTVYTRGQVLSRVAKGLGFSPGLASELGADDPYGDRSKVIWRFSRNAAELGIAQDLTFKLIKATKWNKWKAEPELLKEDIAKAYEQQPAAPTEKDPERAQEIDQYDHHHSDEEKPAEAWGMSTVDQFGPLARQPPSWVLPGIVQEGGVGLLIAAPKVGKTRVAIEIALGVASGLKPLGLSCRPMPVGFFSLEDGEYLFAERLGAGMRYGRYRYHWDGHIKPDLTWVPGQPLNLFTNFATINLTEEHDKQRLLETIVKYGLKLVVIDTLSMAIGNANVSDQKEMNAVLPDVRQIARATGCAIIFIHHTRKRVFEKGESIQESILGSTALHAWCDFIMSLAGPAEEGDPLRMGVQTKRGGGQHLIHANRLKIIKQPVEES